MHHDRKALPVALVLALTLSPPGHAGVPPALDFELSDGARFVTGQTLAVNGGFVMH